ncbi:MAG: ATP-NAD kinase family protein [Betaproteobacteria bacterium]|jgi:predicted polyphosphate/ATP-dependent NAD kinase|nr:MAG: ATP-NAD kinase family protein [Betaproteobacteria bacterium]
MRTIGLIVNPVAGMGGSVGLKGTDGEMYAKALAMGAEPVSPARAREFLSHISCRNKLRLLVAPGPMGADHAQAVGLSYETVGTLTNEPAREDTKSIAGKMLEAGAELIVFAGGDGTARDMADAIDLRIPVIAIPSGVKVYSSVFAYNPRAAAGLLDAFVESADVAEEEVLDIDEDAFRAGVVDSRHYGFLLVPEVGRLLQAGKELSGTTGSTAEVKREIAEAVIEQMVPQALYLLGPGTTVRAIAEELAIEKTLLGVDAIVDGELVGSDLNEHSILELLDRYARAVIVVTPLGGNGFIFGRGNKQFTPKVLRRVGRENIVVIGDRDKLLKLASLHVDTGDPELDESLSGYIDVIVGRNHSKLMRVG